MLSGPQWVSQYPTSRSLADLVDPFRGYALHFVTILRAAGASVVIADTFRPPERAYLMHYAFQIARAKQDPSLVPPMSGVDIEWDHYEAQAAAEEMVRGYGIVYAPALESRHTQGLAVDMTISWDGELSVAGQVIISLPRTGSGNADLHHIGATLGVYKLLSDPPHWSSDGH